MERSSIYSSLVPIPQEQEKRWEWIKYQLRLAGKSMAQIASKNDLTRQALSKVSRCPSPRCEALIALEIGVKPAELWPDRYDVQGLPLSSKRRAA